MVIPAVGIRRADYATPLYPQKLALTSPTSVGRSVGIVRSQTQATEFVCLFSILNVYILLLIIHVSRLLFIGLVHFPHDQPTRIPKKQE
jgi:hypothetical protein